MNFKPWILATRPQFLILAVILAFLGAVLAWYDGHFHLGKAILAGIGLVSAHISVNTLNDYFDYKSGIDQATQRTPFSGGSGMLPSNMLTPKQELWIGIISLVITVPIGIYFILVSGWLLLPLLLVAVFFVIFYSPFILKHQWPEWTAGAGLGTLPILGMYFSQTGFYSVHALIASIPSGLLVHNLLLINEFPDVQADKQAGRRTLPITMGESGAAIFYATAALLVYVWVIAWVIAGVMPVWTLLSLITLPFTIKGINDARHYDNRPVLISGMANNVMAVLITQALIAIGYILAYII